ncbi:hypothetical protein DMJ13_19730 [halophilic archaeon]|nr:hypothetical protein DMJ13_19730 [halophilic archaeon]
MRLIQRTPDRAHPHEEGAKDMLRRHWAIVKALTMVMIVGILVFGIVMGILLVAAESYMGFQTGSLLVLPMMLISGYIARVAVKAVLPIKY